MVANASTRREGVDLGGLISRQPRVFVCSDGSPFSFLLSERQNPFRGEEFRADHSHWESSVNEAKAPARADARLGVLFVHGIGDQPQGMTLVQFAEPIVRWIERRSESLGRRLINAGITYTEITRWENAVSAEWDTSRRDDLLRWKPLLWRFQLDAYLDSKANEGRIPKPTEDATAPVDPGITDIHKVVEKYKKWVPAVVAGADVADGNLRPGMETPAHAWLQLGCIGLDGTIAQTKWLLAESWWAGTFGVPSFRDLIGPSPKLIPAVVGLHFGAGVRRAWRPTALPPILDYTLRSVRVALSILALIAGLVLAAAALVVLFAFYPLALLPIASLRTFASAVQRLLTATLGDSYVLVTSPVRRAAILSRIRRDLEWLAPQCDKIVIVAHSQGAALTYLLLQQATSAIKLGERDENAQAPEWLNKLELLFTFGSGLRKLAEMQRIQTQDSNRVWMYAPFALLGPLSLFSLIDTIAKGTATPISIIVSSVLILMAGLAVYGFAHGTAVSELKFWTALFHGVLNLQWTDHYASADPVPHGPLIEKDTEKEQEYPRAERVFNRGSLITDHTSYWQNEDQFISTVVGSLGKLDGGPFEHVLGTPPSRMERVVALRRLRVVYLACARWLMLAAAGIAVVTHRTEWSLLTEWARQKAASWAIAVLPSELSWPVSVTAKPTPAIVAETAGWLVALAAIHYLVFLLWRLWESEEVDLFFSGSKRDDPSKKLMAFLVAGLAPLAFTLWVCLPEFFQNRGDWLFWGGFAVVVVAGVVYVNACRRRPATVEESPADDKTAAVGGGGQ
jgi:hypothetical protein